MAKENLTKVAFEKKAQEEKEAKEKAEKEAKELKEALKKSNAELEEAKLRNEIEIEEQVKRAKEIAAAKENIDIYVTLEATENKNWPGLFVLNKGQVTTINQTRFDFLVKKVGNFVASLNNGTLRIVKK
jgi:hydroxypyruvate isomerase